MRAIQNAVKGFLVATQACMPAVMHSPRVDGGLTTGLAASYTAGPRRTRGDEGGMAYAYGPVGVNVGYGWTSDPGDGFAARVGIHVPVPLVVAAQTDFYVQVPRRAVLGLDGGVGMAWVPALTIVMPYAQLGALDANGSGFYVTYGFVVAPDRSSADPNYGGGADVPGIAFQKANGRSTTSAFVMAIIARDRRCPDGFSDCVRRDDWSVASGMAVEFRRRK